MELIIFLQFSHSINLREAENANSKGKQEKRQNLKRVLVIITINSPRNLYYFLHPYLFMIMQTRRVQYYFKLIQLKRMIYYVLREITN